MKVWRWIFYLVLLIFPFGQLASFYSPFKEFFFRVHLLDIAGLCFVLYWLFLIKKTKPPFFFRPLAVFGVIAGISLAVKALFLPFGELVLPFFYLLRLYCWILFFWAMTDFIKKEKIDLINLLVLEGLAVSAISLLQYLFLPDTRFLFYADWDDHFFRAIGAFLDPSFNGLILVLAFILCLKKYFGIRQGNKNFYLFFLLLIGITVGLSFSRMSYLILIISFFIILMFKKKYKLLFPFLFFFVLIIFLIPKQTGEGVDLLRKSTSFAKIANYRQVLLISKDNLLLGVGYNLLRNEFFKRGFLAKENWQTSHAGAGADNSFLFVLATTGIFGLLSYLYFWLEIIKRTLKEKEIFFLSAIVSLLVSAFFVNCLFYPWILFWWGTILADFTAEIEA